MLLGRRRYQTKFKELSRQQLPSPSSPRGKNGTSERNSDHRRTLTARLTSCLKTQKFCRATSTNLHEKRNGQVGQALSWRDRCAEETFGGFLSFWCRPWRTLNEEGPPTQFYVLWPEWPALPYLRIPARVRQKRLQLWTGRAFKQASKPKQLAWEMAALPLASVASSSQKLGAGCSAP